MNELLQEGSGALVTTDNGTGVKAVDPMVSAFWDTFTKLGTAAIDGITHTATGGNNNGGASQAQGGGTGAQTGKPKAGITQADVIKWGSIAVGTVVGLLVLKKVLK